MQNYEMHIHWCFILKYIFVLYVLRICENSDSTKYKWKKTAHNKHILFIHTWWYHVRWLTARRRWPSVSISHTLTVGLWGWYEWQPKQSNWEREREIARVRDWKREDEVRDDYEPVKCEGNVLSSTFIFSHASLLLR